MSERTDNQICGKCSYGDNQRVEKGDNIHGHNRYAVLDCHRYPKPLKKYDDEWCGEFKQKEVKS